MKEKMLKFIKKHIITTIILLLYIVRIIQMFFTSTPTPSISQLLILIFGGSYSIIGTSVFFNLIILNRNKKNQCPPVEQTNSDTSKPVDNKTKSTPKISYHKMFNVAGVTYNCKLDKNMKRQKLLEYCKKKDKIHLKQYEYNGKPAFLIVLDKNNLDIGSVPANMVPTILKYKDRNTSIEFVEVSYFKPEDSRKEINYAKVRFLVYKEN